MRQRVHERTETPEAEGGGTAAPPSRNGAEIVPKSATISGAEVDLVRRAVRAPDGTVTGLRRQSTGVLRVLLARRGETVSKDALHAAVWGDIAVTEDSLVQCIGEIRKALGPAREALRTVQREGYRLEAEAAAGAVWRRPWRALASGVAAIVVLAGLLAWGLGAFAPAPPAAKGPVVAVLPFANGSGGERWDRLARGVTDEVIADLGRNDWIAVFASATSARQAGATPQEVHAALGADYVVTGTVHAEGDRVRVSAALADASNGRQVWAESWEGASDDLLALQVAASRALVGELAGAYTGVLARADRQRAHAKTANLAAYDLYLLGIEHKHRFTEQDLHEAESLFLRATDLDPGFAKAWVGLAIVEGFLGAFAKNDAEYAALETRQVAAVERAMAADPEDPLVLIEASRLDAMNGDLDAAASHLRRAVELAPNDADVLAVAAWSAPERSAIPREAVAWADRALALNPARPDWYLTAKGGALLAAREYAAAIEALRLGAKEMLETWINMAVAAGMLGDARTAQEASAQVRRINPDFSLDFYLDGWPWEPAFRALLLEGGRKAGLGAG
jgi:TolB-like protein/DNA-binding winged helix-turn-helix (wHTH) protein